MQCLSPERLKKKTAAQNQQQDEKHAFPPSARDKEDVFTEIWPSSEWHLSSPGTTVSERLSPELGQDHEPVLAKYVILKTCISLSFLIKIFKPTIDCYLT